VAGGGVILILRALQDLGTSNAETSGALGLLPFVPHMSPFGYVILFALIVFSLASWAIMLRKWLTFREIDHQTQAFVAFFRKTPRLSEVNTACDHYRRTPITGLFAAGYQELNAQLQSSKTRSKNPDFGGNPGTPTLSERGILGISRSLQRAAAAELSVLERNMNWLATTASVTPFVGLLGTVVGIIGAFQGLGFEKTASIQVVATPIAEALIATAAGLFAAIPAVIGYNYFVNRLKHVAGEMDDFATEFLNLIERSFS
jgi:biopolymer transport protein TolQ